MVQSRERLVASTRSDSRLSSPIQPHPCRLNSVRVSQELTTVPTFVRPPLHVALAGRRS